MIVVCQLNEGYNLMGMSSGIKWLPQSNEYLKKVQAGQFFQTECGKNIEGKNQ